MAASALKTQGTQLYKVATATTSIEVGNITNFTAPSGVADEIEITNMVSTAKEFMQGLIDYGTCDFDINFYPGTATDTYGQQALLADQAAGTSREWIIGFSDGTASAPTVTSSAFGAPNTARSWVKFTGFVKQFTIKGGTNDKGTGTLSIRVSGSPTWYYHA